MFQKKDPVLTATFCNQLENVRLAIEVLTGQHVRFQHIDFNTGRAKAHIGGEERNFSFIISRDDLINFAFGDLKEWYTARIDQPGEIRVIKDSGNTHKRAGWDMWWIGRSATDRWEEPLYLRQAEYCAEVRGLSLEEYLSLPVD